MTKLTGRIHVPFVAIELKVFVLLHVRQIAGTQFLETDQSLNVAVHCLVADLHLGHMPIEQIVFDQRQFRLFGQLKVHIIIVLALRQTRLQLLALQLELDRITVQRAGRMLGVELLQQLLDRFDFKVLGAFSWIQKREAKTIG